MAAGGWFGRRTRNTRAMESLPDGIATKCDRCATILFVRDFERNLRVCTRCGHHHRLSASERIAATVDDGSFVETASGLMPTDPLSFPGYADKLVRYQETTGLADAIVTGRATIEGLPAVVGAADFAFSGGSMGSVVGEKVALALELGAEERIPVVMFAASGGARMWEGLLSLMQMAKTSAAAGRLDRARVPYIVVLTDPTTGGVFASYASIADIVLAEPNATVGFAGRRVGNQDAGTRLPDNFQTSEFQVEHGMVDRIVQRKDLRATLAALLAFFAEGGARGQ